MAGTSKLTLGTLTLLGLSSLFCKMKTSDSMILSLLHLLIKQVTIKLLLYARQWGYSDDQDRLGSCSHRAYIPITKTINKENTSDSEEYQEQNKEG